jgi:demethylmenaquinone methyltransferase/2-methoxy-6-polyprenyl-1,4-benzoquinol methylase
MFDRIAPRYDAMNRLLTFGLDRGWRRRALAHIRVGPGDRVLDVACGTGDLAEMSRALGARVFAVDFAPQMLRGARERGIDACFFLGDAERLPLPDAAVSVVTCGFALRNFASLEGALAEMARVLEPGGRIALIEVNRPRHRMVAAAHSLYFDRVVPRVGGWLADREAYRYLPQSTAYLPPPPELRRTLERADFADLEHRLAGLGAVQLLTGRRR